MIYHMVGNHVLRLRSRVAVKLNFGPFIWQYTSPNQNFEYSYPLIGFITRHADCCTVTILYPDLGWSLSSLEAYKCLTFFPRNSADLLNHYSSDDQNWLLIPFIDRTNVVCKVVILGLNLSLGCLAQSVTCLATDACLTADPGVVSSIPAWSNAYVDWSWNNFYGHSAPSHWMNHSRRVIASYEQKYVHEVLVNRLFKLAQEKVWLGELTFP